jgi:putative phosphoribosyl transferase
VLAEALVARGYGDSVTVLGLPRGGVPVARPVADALGAPLDVLVVRKLGVPGHEELAMGAVASGGVRVLDPAVLVANAVEPAELAAVTGREQAAVERGDAMFRGGRPPAPVAGRDIMVVDDGLATGSTMLAAVRALRQAGAARVVVAVPVGSNGGCAVVATEADELVCPLVPRKFLAVGAWYDDFRATSDEEVCALLAESAQQ